MSIYRRQKEDKNVLYNNLKDCLKKVKDRYSDVKIFIGGDFNDNLAPNSILNLVKSSPKIFSRFNIQEGLNTTIDHIYGDQTLDVGTLAVMHPKDESRDAGQHFRKKIQSDHLALFAWVDLQPVKSSRLPRINKLKILKIL
jgi:hypothetical protein